MVKIALDIENYDKFVEIVNNIDKHIKDYEKQLDTNSDSFLPKNTGSLEFGLSKDKTAPSKGFSRKYMRIFKDLSCLYEIIPGEIVRKVGRHKLKLGRPHNIIKKTDNFYDMLDKHSKLILLNDLFKDNQTEYQTISLKMTLDNLDTIANSENFIIYYPLTNSYYIILQILDDRLVLFRFKDIILNNALILRLNEIVRIFEKQNIILRKNLIKFQT